MMRQRARDGLVRAYLTYLWWGGIDDTAEFLTLKALEEARQILGGDHVLWLSDWQRAQRGAA